MANGTIAFDTLQTSGQITGTAKSLDTDFVVNGSAKAWHHANEDATPVVEDSFNVASLTDTANGRQGINLTNNMANTNYVAQASNHESQVRFYFTGSLTTSSYISEAYANNASAYQDAHQNSIAHGDLA